MTSQLNPYLNFNGNARQAMQFYAALFGGELTLTTFDQFGSHGPDAQRIMHGALRTDDGYMIMGADVMSDKEYEPIKGTSVSISGDDSEQLHRYWVELSAGGNISVPLAKQPWGDEFGVCTDRFGVPWMIDIGEPQG
jgi:PhnB protein